MNRSICLLGHKEGRKILLLTAATYGSGRHYQMARTASPLTLCNVAAKEEIP